MLSKGVWKFLQVCPETLDALRSGDVTFHVHQTEEAVRVYNALRETDTVGGLFHSTC